jgi:apolipoprotein N-acyltransferase
MSRASYRFGHKIPVWPAFLLMILGGIAALGQAPIDAWYATLIAFFVIFKILSRAEGGTFAALFGFCAGFGYFAVTMNWIIQPFFIDLKQDGWMAPFALILMSTGLAVFWAVACGLAYRAMQGIDGKLISRSGFILALILCLSSAEYLRGVIFTGFPWALIGHVWINTPVAQLAAFVGPNSLTVLLLMLAGLPIIYGLRGIFFSALALAAVVAFGLNRLNIVNPMVDWPLTVRLVQPNAKQSAKWNPSFAQLYLDRQLAFTTVQPLPDIVIWPETAVPYYSLDDTQLVTSLALAAQGRPLLFGYQRYDGVRAWNSLGLIDKNGTFHEAYDKHHLVPFGEYMPFGDFLYEWFGLAGLAAQEGYTYSAGMGPKLINLGPLGTVLPLICYEVVFPQIIHNAPRRPDWILQITNDAWFGNFSGPAQHLAQARLRAIEQGLPLVRVANTGISAIIDPYGRITAHLPLNQAGFKDGTVARALPPTFYALLAEQIFFAWMGALAVILIFVRLKFRS